jgi:glycosyltransferase involved in cell wall biosynthesis
VVRYWSSFDAALGWLAHRYPNVLTFYVPPQYRLAYAQFRARQSATTRFHFLYTTWPESRIKREALFAEARLAPYNGQLFCLSPRLCRRASAFSDRAVLLYPPVPPSFFLQPEDKPSHERLRLTYMGRIDPGKGAMQAFQLFEQLQHSGKYETRICGYPWRHDPASMRLHEQLLAQSDVRYEPTEFSGYAPLVDQTVSRVMRETDVLYLPYNTLSTTIDTPLVVLEGMAHLCAIVTRPLGDLPATYGTQECMVADVLDYSEVQQVFSSLTARLAAERQRLADHRRELAFDQASVADRFMKAITNGS